MPQFQDRLRRITNVLRVLRSRRTAAPESILTDLAEAMEEITKATEQIELRLQKLETGKTR